MAHCSESGSLVAHQTSGPEIFASNPLSSTKIFLLEYFLGSPGVGGGGSPPSSLCSSSSCYSNYVPTKHFLYPAWEINIIMDLNRQVFYYHVRKLYFFLSIYCTLLCNTKQMFFMFTDYRGKRNISSLCFGINLTTIFIKRYFI